MCEHVDMASVRACMCACECVGMVVHLLASPNIGECVYVSLCTFGIHELYILPTCNTTCTVI